MVDKKIIATNPHLNNFKVYKTIEAGLVLSGPEAKSVRLFGLNLRAATVTIHETRAFLVGAKIQPYFYANQQKQDKSLPLLLHKKEISHLYGKLAAKFVLIPTKVYWKNHKIKIEIAIAHKLKKWQKKEKLKKKDMDRQRQIQLKNFKTAW